MVSIFLISLWVVLEGTMEFISEGSRKIRNLERKEAS